MLLNENFRHEASSGCVNGILWDVSVFILLGDVDEKESLGLFVSMLSGVVMTFPAALRMQGHLIEPAGAGGADRVSQG